MSLWWNCTLARAAYSSAERLRMRSIPASAPVAYSFVPCTQASNALHHFTGWLRVFSLSEALVHHSLATRVHKNRPCHHPSPKPAASTSRSSSALAAKLTPSIMTAPCTRSLEYLLRSSGRPTQNSSSPSRTPRSAKRAMTQVILASPAQPASWRGEEGSLS